jgi:hypothetical protein
MAGDRWPAKRRFLTQRALRKNTASMERRKPKRAGRARPYNVKN